MGLGLEEPGITGQGPDPLNQSALLAEITALRRARQAPDLDFDKVPSAPMTSTEALLLALVRGHR